MPSRPRRWGAQITAPGEPVQLRNYAVPALGEDLTEDPPTVTISWAQWLTDHRTAYGLTVDGRPRAEAIADRDALLRVKAKAAADPDFAALARLVLRVDPADPDPPPVP